MAMIKSILPSPYHQWKGSKSSFTPSHHIINGKDQVQGGSTSQPLIPLHGISCMDSNSPIISKVFHHTFFQIPLPHLPQTSSIPSTLHTSASISHLLTYTNYLSHISYILFILLQYVTLTLLQIILFLICFFLIWSHINCNILI